jgi:hypothetical protein
MTIFTGTPSSKKNLVTYLASSSIALSLLQNGGQIVCLIPAPKDPRLYHSEMRNLRVSSVNIHSRVLSEPSIPKVSNYRPISLCQLNDIIISMINRIQLNSIKLSHGLILISFVHFRERWLLGMLTVIKINKMIKFWFRTQESDLDNRGIRESENLSMYLKIKQYGERDNKKLNERKRYRKRSKEIKIHIW